MHETHSFYLYLVVIFRRKKFSITNYETRHTNKNSTDQIGRGLKIQHDGRESFKRMFPAVINNNILSGKNTFHERKKMTLRNKFKEIRYGKNRLKL